MTRTPEGGRPRPTIKDIARETGVSKSLVSLALAGRSGVSEASRDRILATARDLGYSSNTWARSLVRGKTQLIGVVTTDLANSYHTEIVTAVEDEAERDGYGVLLAHGRRSPETLADKVDEMLRLGVDGLVVVSSRVPAERLAEAAARRPLVVVGRPAAVPEAADSIHNDDEAGARLAVRHLIDLGHERIVFVATSQREAMQARQRAYRRTLEEAGLGIGWVIHWGQEGVSAESARAVLAEAGLADAGLTAAGVTEAGYAGTGFTGAGFADAGLTEAGAPTAVFVSNDRAAVALMGAALDAGISVPQQLSMIGYDNTALAAAIRPALTSIDQPRTMMGGRAVQLLLERIEGRVEPLREVVAPSLAQRASTSAPGVRSAARGRTP
ncbi:transcriptional regulator, LacI family [Brevibacterium yomogidense]|uniref:Transcriptional regulator, LacI family n=2 Tax=Brevibacterium yomogidense TaxID=946573 RepID=A0A1X6XLE4_9MICO|nr:transcriptional regulator, LacI family [Brevibacterium yomogidense]